MARCRDAARAIAPARYAITRYYAACPTPAFDGAKAPFDAIIFAFSPTMIAVAIRATSRHRRDATPFRADQARCLLFFVR